MTQELHSACYKRYLSNNHFQRDSRYEYFKISTNLTIHDSRIHERGSMKCKSHTIKKGSDKAIKGFLTMRKENVKHHVGCKMK